MIAVYKFCIPFILILLAGCSGVEGEKRSAGAGSENPTKAVIFHRVSEPNEQAFTLLLPENWKLSGGVSRVDPMSAEGSGNAVEAKLYMKITSADDRYEMGWLPDTRFFDMRRYPGVNPAAPVFPDGSDYNGMQVMPFPSPVEFILRVAVPFAHPHAKNLKITAADPLYSLAEEYSEMSARLLKGNRFSYQAALVTLEYSENRIQYLEKMVCVIEDYGLPGAGLWGNKETWYARAVKDDFDTVAAVFATVGQSVRFNTEWLRREIHIQQVNGNIAIQTQQMVEQPDREIAGHKTRINAEINNDMYLNLTSQEDYTNPFTGETERGSNEWNYRWENDRGDVIYHNNQNYNPNEDAGLKVNGFKRSEIRKR